MLVVAVHVIAPVNLINLARSGAGPRYFEITGKRKHGKVAGVLVEANNHDGISELGAVMGTITFGSFHIVAAGAKSKDVGATIFVGLKWFVVVIHEGEKVENIALTAGDFGDDVVAP